MVHQLYVSEDVLRMQYHYVQTRKAKIKKTVNTTCWQGYGETQNHSYIADGNAKQYSHFRKLAGFKKVKYILTIFDPTIALLGIYPREMKNMFTYVTCT